MKITDYGLWFKDFSDSSIWVKCPTKTRAYDVFVNGVFIGRVLFCGCHSWVYKQKLILIGLKLRTDVPGETNACIKTIWDFPDYYTPTESDFEEIE